MKFIPDYIVFLFLFLLLEPLFRSHPYTKYFYIVLFSILVIIAVGIVFKTLSKNQLKKEVLYLIAILIIGLISGIVNQVSTFTSIGVIMYSFKFILIYFIASELTIHKYGKIEIGILYVLFFELLIGFIQFTIPSFNSWMIDITVLNQPDFYIEKIKSFGVIGTVGSKNMFGLLMNIGLIISIKQYIQNNKKNNLIIIFLFAIGILISASKINILLMGFLLLYLMSKKVSLPIVGFFVFVLTILFVSLSVLISFVDLRIFHLFDNTYWNIAEEFGRIALLNISMDIIYNNPFFGIGPGNWGTGLAFSKSSSTEYYAIYENYKISRTVLQDNYWVSEVSQFGLIYFIVLVMFLTFIYKQSEKSLVSNYFFIVILISSFVYPTIVMKPIGLLFWLFAGIFKKRK